MALWIPTAKQLAGLDADVLLRVLAGDPTALGYDPELRARLDAAAEEMDRAGETGLTVSVREIRVLDEAEGIWGRWFGASGEIYVLTAALDGSGRALEYRTRSFRGIDSGDSLPLGDGGMVVAWLVDPRWFVDIHMVVMESDSDIRMVGPHIEAARREAGLDELLGLASSAPEFEPEVVGRVAHGVDIFLDTLTHLLRMNGDDHVATIHDFYLKHQAFGQGRHPAEGLRRFQGVEMAYEMALTPLAALAG